MLQITHWVLIVWYPFRLNVKMFFNLSGEFRNLMYLTIKEDNLEKFEKYQNLVKTISKFSNNKNK